jgi:rhodanese-related sulfurtransferase
MFGRIDAAGLHAMLGQVDPPRLIDVRTAEEIARGRIGGAEHFELAGLPARIAELDPQTPLVLYCAVGGRSAQACAFLAQRGFQRLYSLDGGLTAWAKAGLPVSS